MRCPKLFVLGVILVTSAGPPAHGKLTGFQFTGMLLQSFPDPWGISVPVPNSVTGRFHYDSASLESHPLEDCSGDCAVYRQHIPNGFLATFGSLELRADEYYVVVQNDVPDIFAAELQDVLSIRFNVSLNPTDKLTVNGIVRDEGFFDLGMTAVASTYSTSELPSNFNFSDFASHSIVVGDRNSGIANLFALLSSLEEFPILPGDYNLDGVVDIRDFDRWKSSYGAVGDIAADGNGSGVLDAADYTVWRDNLSAATNAASPLLLHGIPEPSTLQIAFVIMFLGNLCTFLRIGRLMG